MSSESFETKTSETESKQDPSTSQNINKSKKSKKGKYFMFVKRPNAAGARDIISILKNNGYIIDHSYDICKVDLNNYDCIIIPGGTARIQQNDLGQEGINKILSFVSNGGNYIGICAGAYLGSFNEKKGVGIKLLQNQFFIFGKQINLKGKITLRINDDSCEWFDTNLIEFQCVYHNGAFWDIDKINKINKNIKDNNDKIKIIAKIKQGINDKMKNKAAIICGKYGKGKVLLCGPHPEQTKELKQFTLNLLTCVL